MTHCVMKRSRRRTKRRSPAPVGGVGGTPDADLERSGAGPRVELRAPETEVFAVRSRARGDGLRHEEAMSKSTLKAEAVATVTRLKERGLAFVEETRVATTSLLTDTRDAGERFVGTTRDAGEQLVSALREETEAFVRLARELAAMPRLPAPAEVRELAETEARERGFELQKQLLVRLKKTLAQVEAKVDERLGGLEAPKKSKPKATKPKAASPKSGAKSANGAPLAGYDALTAKEVLAKLTTADAETAAAVVAYEKANKNRKTIVEAAEKAAA